MNIELVNYILGYTTVEIKKCGRANKDNNWIETSSKSCYDMWAVLRGRIQISVNDCEYELKRGDAFLLYPNMVYTATTITEKAEFLYVNFDFVMGNNPKALESFPFAGYVPNEAIEMKISTFISSFNNYMAKKPISSFEFKGQFIVALSHIILYRLDNPETQLASTNTQRNISRIHDVLSYISKNINKKILNSELAELSKMSEKYFIGFFKKTMGMTPSKYITKEKMKKAAFMLYEQKYSVKEISQKLGYSDQYVFSKVFSKTYRTPPSRFI